MDKCLSGKKESERTPLKLDNLSHVRRELKLFEKTTLKSVSTIVKNTLPCQQSK